jgi:pSer/pThr/pTyr-binding forkhead associated (FHA) protein
MENTIISSSQLGKRFIKIPKPNSWYIRFAGNNVPAAGKITIGRARTNAICLDDDNMVSREHAVIQKLKYAYFIKDLNSTNGTWVNDQQVPRDKYMRIRNQDIIRIGRTELMFRDIVK